MPVPSESAAAAVVAALRDAGHVAYFAGGCVRDRLLGLSPTDYDVATDAPPERVRSLFKNTQAVGAAFGVILVRHAGVMIEVATFRSDGPYADGRRPESVTFATAEADANRRDFTINGLFYDPATGDVIDYVGGQTDLAAKVLRAIGDPAARFAEDHLRLLRAVRFAARFGLTIEPATAAAIDAAAPLLPRVSAERIAEELRRILTASTRDMGYRLLLRHGLLRELLPSLAGGATPDERTDAGAGVAAGEGANGTESHRSLFLRLSPGAPIAFPVAWLAVMIDLRWRASGWKADVLGNLSPRDAAALVTLARATLKASNDELDAMADIARQCHAVLNTPRPDDAMLKRLLARPTADQSRQLLDALAGIGAAADRIAALRLRFESLSRGDVAPRPLLSGDDLVRTGVRPGPAFKRVLDAVYDAQLNGDVADMPAALRLATQLLDEK